MVVSSSKLLDTLTLLEEYSGKNPYILKLKESFIKGKGGVLTDGEIEYISKNYNFEPLLINKIINITTFLGENLKKKYSLENTPTKIAIKYVLGKTEKSYHVLAKCYKNQAYYEMLFLPKTQILDDIFYNDKMKLDINYEEIEKLNKEGRMFYKHQKDGMQFLLNRKKAILADDMGLMKSSTLIGASIAGNFKKILIICPANLKTNWKNELSYFFKDSEYEAIYGDKWVDKKYTIINYDILSNFYTYVDNRKKKEKIEALANSELFNSKFDLIIIDEAHYLKNYSTQRSKLVHDFLKFAKAEYVWLASGTIMSNRPINLFSPLKLIDCDLADNYMYFVNRYCNGKRILNKKTGKKVLIANGASNLEELSLKLKSYYLRREKDLLDDLPEKIFVNKYFQLTDEQQSEYGSLWDEYVKRKELEGEKVNVEKQFGEIMPLRKFISLAMMPNTIDLVEQIISNDEKVVIFCTFVEEILEIHRRIPNSTVHYGNMTSKERDESVSKFINNKNCKCIIGQIGTLGTGLNLTNSCYTIHNSRDFEADKYDQANSRQHRKGQTKKTTIYNMAFLNSISMKIEESVNEKMKNINKVIIKN